MVGARLRLWPLAEGKRLTRWWAVLGTPGPTRALFFQERIFLTVSNYIFTAIFVGEMTLKVAPGFTWDPLPPPAWDPWLWASLSESFSLTCLSATFHARPWRPVPARCQPLGWAPGTQRG